MRKSRVETAETRKRIVEVAARTFKRNGVQGTGVSEIMAEAGLTHGGFYRHFTSKEQLLMEACAASLDALVETAETAADGTDEGFQEYLGKFLSTEFRDDCLGGCPLVAMGSELVRADDDTRRVATTGFKGLIDALTKRVYTDDSAEAHDAALFALSSMIGAVTMARIVDDKELSDRVLSVTRKRLTQNAAKFVPDLQLKTA